MHIIFIIGIFISLFQVILLVNKKSKSLPDKILACWMLIVCIHLMNYYLYYQGYWEKYPHLIGITVPFPLFYGPMLYLYVSHSLERKNHLFQKDYLHFLPIFLAYLYMCKFYFFYSAEEKRLVDMGKLDDFDAFSNILLFAIVVSGICYSIYSYRLLNKFSKIINDNFSNTESVNLDWLKSFIGGLGLIFLAVLIEIITRDFMGITYGFNPDYIHYSMLVFAILALGYFGIRHENIFVDNIVVVGNENGGYIEKENGGYKKSGLKEDTAKNKYSALLALMTHQKPYLQPKLTLTNLAKLLDISPNHLSQIINQFEKQNFNDFVNKYRVEEFIQRASSNGHLSFLGLAIESGFNSKSTFNSVFKKHKGMTPSQYMSAHKG